MKLVKGVLAALLLAGCMFAASNGYYVRAEHGEYVKLVHDGKVILAHCTSVTFRGQNYNRCEMPDVGTTVQMERWNNELTWQMDSQTVVNFYIDSDNYNDR